MYFEKKIFVWRRMSHWGGSVVWRRCEFKFEFFFSFREFWILICDEEKKRKKIKIKWWWNTIYFTKIKRGRKGYRTFLKREKKSRNLMKWLYIRRENFEEGRCVCVWWLVWWRTCWIFSWLFQNLLEKIYDYYSLPILTLTIDDRRWGTTEWVTVTGVNINNNHQNKQSKLNFNFNDCFYP